MKKFLLTLIVTMLAFVGTWAQENAPSLTLSPTSVDIDVTDKGGVFIVYELKNPPTSSYGSKYVFSDGSQSENSVAKAEWSNWDGTKNGNFVKITPKAAGSTSFKYVIYDYSTGNAYAESNEVTVNVVDKTLATSLSVASTATVAKGYSTELDVTFAPATANGFTVAVEGNDKVQASLSSDFKKLTITAASDAEVNSTATVTVTPKTGSTASAATVTVTVVDPVSIESIALAPNTSDILIGKTITLVPTFTPANPATKKLTWTSSDESKATVDANGVVTGVARGTATITATSESINNNDPVVATATINVKQELAPANDVQPKTTFKVGETYVSQLSLADATLGTISYTSDNAEVLSVDNTGKLTALKVGTAHISVTIEPTDEAKAGNYVAWVRPLTITVVPGEFGLTLTNVPTSVEQGTGGTIAVTPAVTLNGAETTNTAYSIAYSLEGASSDITIDATTGAVTVPTTASVQQFAVVATLTPTDATNYKGATAKAAVLVSNSSAKVQISVDEDGVYTVYVPSPGAFGTQWLDDPISGQTAPATLVEDATLDGLKTAASVKVTGLLANSDVQELIHLIGDQTQLTTGGVCTSLDMSGSQMTEAITAHNAYNDANCPSISWINDGDYWSHRLFYLEELSLPTPCPTNTTIPSNMLALWTNNNVTLQSLIIPEGWTETAEKSFSDNTGNPMKVLTTLSLPNSLEKIGAYSFINIQVETLYMPKNIKYIGEFAFGSTPKLTDIYFTGDGKDLKYVDRTAFGSQTQLCNNSVDDQAQNGKQMPTINRGNYTNGGVPVCIMHFPKGCDAEYTDVTRSYTVLDTSGNEGAYPSYGKGNYVYTPSGTYADGTEWVWTDEFKNTVNSKVYSSSWSMSGIVVDGAFPDDTYGYSFIWPSQSQMTYGYAIANAGYLWNMQPMSKDQLDPENGVDKRGLYQFIIGMGNAPSDKDKWVFPQNYEQDKWYTFSVPFDMSVEQIKDVFGATTQVCRISKVVRDIVTTEGKEKKTLRLEFRNSVMQENDGRPSDIEYSDGVEQAGIRHHYPYMIKPGSAVSELQAEFKEDGKRVLPDYQTIPGNLMIETKIAVKNDNTATEFEYMFCPILMEGKLKKNSYIFANYGGKHQFVFFKGVKNTTNEYEDGGTANANTAYVQLIHGATDLSDFYVAASTEQGNQAPINATILGDDEAVNGIEEVVIVCGDNKVEDGKIYTINGVLVNSNSLPAGLYIKNGKKFIVK